ncbi:hypothetical protein EDD86DRAFT_248479 [Gorgonomyces haynaldii]|nr:hypothetical protein EDD86DRAFT_248479 [Gorgonomyces haynaldii]
MSHLEYLVDRYHIPSQKHLLPTNSFILHCLHTLPINLDQFTASIYYMDRLPQLKECCGRRLFCAALLVAHKQQTPLSLSNEEWASLLRMSPQQMTDYEHVILTGLPHMDTTSEDFSDWLDQWRYGFHRLSSY